MARRVINHTIVTEGRDCGKTYIITEMAASDAEEWAMRALLGLMSSGVDLPDGIERMGMAGMAQVGFKALLGLQWDTLKPLLDTMWLCISMLPDPTKPHITRPLIDSDVEEVETRIALRWEVLNLHVDFSKAAGLLKSKASAAPVATRKVRRSRTT